MPNASNAQLQYEASQSQVPMVALSDSGDATFFESADTLWSAKSGFTADVKPDGVVTGFTITTDVVDDTVNIAAGTLYQAGVLQSVSAAADEDITPEQLF